MTQLVFYNYERNEFEFREESNLEVEDDTEYFTVVKHGIYHDEKIYMVGFHHVHVYDIETKKTSVFAKQ